MREETDTGSGVLNASAFLNASASFLYNRLSHRTNLKSISQTSGFLITIEPHIPSSKRNQLSQAALKRALLSLVTLRAGLPSIHTARNSSFVNSVVRCVCHRIVGLSQLFDPHCIVTSVGRTNGWIHTHAITQTHAPVLCSRMKAASASSSSSIKAKKRRARQNCSCTCSWVTTPPPPACCSPCRCPVFRYFNGLCVKCLRGGWTCDCRYRACCC